jgi:hypothetical protein
MGKSGYDHFRLLNSCQKKGVIKTGPIRWYIHKTFTKNSFIRYVRNIPHCILYPIAVNAFNTHEPLGDFDISHLKDGPVTQVDSKFEDFVDPLMPLQNLSFYQK